MPELKIFILLVELVSSLVIFGYCIAGFVVLIIHRSRIQSQIMVANGAVLGLSIKLVGAFLKTIEMQSWNQLAQFAAIILLRTMVKKVFLKDYLRAIKEKQV